MTTYFNGKKIAQEKFEELKKRVSELKKKGITPKLVSILVGEDAGSVLYLNLKKKAAERIGCELEIKKLDSNTSMNRFIDVIEKANEDERVHGIMVQLPLPGDLKLKTKDLIQHIKLDKDVDGMRTSLTAVREDGKFLSPVVLAVEVAFGCGEEYISCNNYPYKAVVVGGSGFVGRMILKRFDDYNSRIYRVISVNSKTENLKEELEDADYVISVTGKAGLIKKKMIKPGSVLIDVGSPMGDIEKAAYEKASFVSPVPGGIGPLTIYFLMENLVKAATA